MKTFIIAIVIAIFVRAKRKGAVVADAARIIVLNKAWAMASGVSGKLDVSDAVVDVLNAMEAAEEELRTFGFAELVLALMVILMGLMAKAFAIVSAGIVLAALAGFVKRISASIVSGEVETVSSYDTPFAFITRRNLWMKEQCYC